MYDYILPVSNKDIVNIAKRAFNLVDPRLMGHGERVANIMFQIMEAEGGYTPVQMRNLLTLAVLHDIGAYKTEEIDHMVEFETKHVWNHSIYGYLFLNYFSLFKELSRVVLFHHSSWKQLEQMDDVPGHVKKAAQLLQLADRLDFYFENPKNRMGRESFLSYLERERGKKFSSEVINLLLDTPLVPPSCDYIGIFPQFDRIMETVPFTEEEKESILQMLIYAIDFRSPHTVTHTIPTSVISSELAILLCGQKDTVNDVMCGAMLHDLGKIGIPVEILEYPGKLSPQAMNVMRNHVNLTEYILGNSVSGTVKNIALRHHEKLDGSGYPRGLKAADLNVPQRIVAIADIVSALTGTRSYKGAYSKNRTLGVLTGMAQQGLLDSGIVGLLVERYDEIMDSVRKKTGPLLEKYQEMQDRYWDILYQLEEKEEKP